MFLLPQYGLIHISDKAKIVGVLSGIFQNKLCDWSNMATYTGTCSHLNVYGTNNQTRIGSITSITVSVVYITFRLRCLQMWLARRPNHLRPMRHIYIHLYDGRIDRIKCGKLFTHLTKQKEEKNTRLFCKPTIECVPSQVRLTVSKIFTFGGVLYL